VQLYRYFVSQSSEFYRHNPLCCFSMSVCRCLFHYRLGPETYGYTLVCLPFLTKELNTLRQSYRSAGNPGSRMHCPACV